MSDILPNVAGLGIGLTDRAPKGHDSGPVLHAKLKSVSCLHQCMVAHQHQRQLEMHVNHALPERNDHETARNRSTKFAGRGVK